jgi:hypothetical protein
MISEILRFIGKIAMTQLIVLYRWRMHAGCDASFVEAWSRVAAKLRSDHSVAPRGTNLSTDSDPSGGLCADVIDSFRESATPEIPRLFRARQSARRRAVHHRFPPRTDIPLSPRAAVPS